MINRAKGFWTIQDVALLAGVSVATVSAVLNNKGTASAKMKGRVEEAMTRLDFHPDNMARSLKTGKSRVLGMVVPDVTNPFFTEIMAGMENMARIRGYSVILSNSDENPAREQENLNMLHAQRVEGVILTCASGSAVHERTAKRRFPIVFVDRIPEAGFSGRAVIVDNQGAALEATRHLIQLGHSRIAIITGRPDISVSRERAAGYRKAMQEEYLPIRESYYCEGDFLPESGYCIGLKLMRLSEPPTAIFSCNNSMTLGLMRALAEIGVSCPEQLSIVTFDDFPWANYFQPQLTAVAQPAREIGRQAMRMLLAVLEPNSDEAREIREPIMVLKAQLRTRQSTSALRSG